MTGLPFELPVPPGSKIAPTWIGNGFLLDGVVVQVLRYANSESGWSEEITEYHDSAYRRHHWVNVSSRQNALLQIKTYSQGIRSENRRPTILEIGSPPGFFLEEASAQLPEAILIGSDYIAAPLELLALRMANLPMIQFDITQCPLPDKSLDVVVALNVLEHIESDDVAAGEIFRILRHAGIAIIEVPAGPGLFDSYDTFYRHHRRYHKRALVRMLRRSGFRVLSASHLGFLVYPGFWMAKKINRVFGKANTKKDLLQDSVEKQIGISERPTLLSLQNKLATIENRLRRIIYLPFGIRCVVTVQKP